MPEKHSPAFSPRRISRNFQCWLSRVEEIFAGVKLWELGPILLLSKPTSAVTAQPVLGLLAPFQVLLQAPGSASKNKTNTKHTRSNMKFLLCPGSPPKPCRAP